jgi:hypothetical protein
LVLWRPAPSLPQAWSSFCRRSRSTL